MSDLKHFGADILRTELEQCRRRSRELATENIRLTTERDVLRAACEFVEGRLSDRPLTSRTPDERLDELEEWLDDEVLPRLRDALGRAEPEPTTTDGSHAE